MVATDEPLRAHLHRSRAGGMGARGGETLGRPSPRLLLLTLLPAKPREPASTSLTWGRGGPPVGFEPTTYALQVQQRLRQRVPRRATSCDFSWSPQVRRPRRWHLFPHRPEASSPPVHFRPRSGTPQQLRAACSEPTTWSRIRREAGEATAGGDRRGRHVAVDRCPMPGRDRQLGDRCCQMSGSRAQPCRASRRFRQSI